LSAETRSPILEQYNVLLPHRNIYLWSKFIDPVPSMSGNSHDPTLHPTL